MVLSSSKAQRKLGSNFVLQHEGQEASAIFELRRVGDERAYTHPVGLSLVISDARPQGDKRVHELHSRIFLSQQSLGEVRGTLPFLRLLRSGATLSVDGKQFGPIENLGPAIITLGPAVEALEKIATLVNLDLNGFYPSDFAVEEFGHSVGFLDAFLLQQIPAHRFVPAFVVGPSAGTDPSQLATERVRVELPLS